MVIECKSPRPLEEEDLHHAFLGTNPCIKSKRWNECVEVKTERSERAKLKVIMIGSYLSSIEKSYFAPDKSEGNSKDSHCFM